MAAGMPNLGNTCYINTVLQCLAHCPAFVAKLDTEVKELAAQPPFACELTNVVVALAEGSSRLVHPGNLLSFIKGRWTVHDAQDVQEFFMFLIEALNETIKCKVKIRGLESISSKLWRASIAHWFEAVGSEYSFLKDMFYGQYIQSISCGACGATCTNFEVFCCLALPMHKVNTQRSLEACIAEFFAEERIDDWKCDKCDQKGTAKRDIAVSRLPVIVVISINRFDAALRKNMSPIMLPETLDMSSVNIIERPAMYDLASFACHSGAYQSGHYWSVVRRTHHERGWLRVDDIFVTAAEDLGSFSKDCYMAFYQRRLR